MSVQNPDGVFPWHECVPHFVHPLKVVIIEALVWIDRPLSATDLRWLMDDGTGATLFSYHLRGLSEVGIVVNVRKEKVRGTFAVYYRLQPASGFWTTKSDQQTDTF